jgi:putative hydrolase of the HAD superfamily
MIAALTLDLDDTLWPIAPVMQRAELALDAWLRAHCPEVAAAFPIEAMRLLREQVWLEHPHLAHDFTSLRKLSLQRAFATSGHAATQIERAFEVFYSARNEVELYADALPALARLAQRWPLASISNGNADLQRIGLAGHFRATLHAREVGCAKPQARIFHAAAAALGVAPHAVAHVGDDPELDVRGAREAGMVAVWLNRTEASWPLADMQPDITVAGLDQLEAALDQWAALRQPPLEPMLIDLR